MLFVWRYIHCLVIYDGLLKKNDLLAIERESIELYCCTTAGMLSFGNFIKTILFCNEQFKINVVADLEFFIIRFHAQDNWFSKMNE